MNELRCSCRKLLCTIEGDTIIIKCHHCKAFVHIHTNGIVKMEYKIEQPDISKFLGGTHHRPKHAYGK